MDSKYNSAASPPNTSEEVAAPVKRLKASKKSTPQSVTEEKANQKKKPERKAYINKPAKEASAIKAKIRGQNLSKNIVLNLDESADRSYAKKIRNYSASRAVVSKSITSFKTDLITKGRVNMRNQKAMSRDKSLSKPNISSSSLHKEDKKMRDGRSYLPTEYATVPINDKSIKSKNKMNKSKLGKPISVNLFNENSEENKQNTEVKLDLHSYLRKSSDPAAVIQGGADETPLGIVRDSVGKAKVIQMNLGASTENDETKEENIHPNMTKEISNSPPFKTEENNFFDKLEDMTPMISQPPLAQPQMPKPTMQKALSKTHRGSPKESMNAFTDEFDKVELKKRRTKEDRVVSLLESQAKTINKIFDASKAAKFEDAYTKLKQYDLLYERLQDSTK